jgi:hypothetical protein
MNSEGSDAAAAVRPLVQRFPRHDMQLHRRYRQDEEFRLLCDDHYRWAVNSDIDCRPSPQSVTSNPDGYANRGKVHSPGSESLPKSTNRISVEPTPSSTIRVRI